MNPISVAASIVSYVGDGVTRDFTFSFPYLANDHVVAYVDEVPVTIVLVAPNVARLASLPALGAYLEIRRETPTDPIYPIVEGVITDEMLDINTRQARYIAEEARDIAESALRYNDALQAYNAKGRRIGRVAPPVQPDDVMTKQSVDAEIARILAGDPLANLIQDASDAAAQSTIDRTYIESLDAEFAAGLVSAQTLHDEALAGPTGEELVRRITEYLGSDGWTSGGGASFIPASGSHDYWRVRLTATPRTQLGAALAELQFREVAGVSQQATGGTAISNRGDGSAWTSATAAFDNTTTGTGAFTSLATTYLDEVQAGTKLAYIGYQFGAAKAIAEVAIYGSSYYPNHTLRKIGIEYSDNGTTWTRVAEPVIPNLTNGQVHVAATGHAVAHVYWRICVLDADPYDYYTRIKDIQFRTQVDNVETHTAGVDGTVAYGAGITGASAGQAFDNNLNTWTITVPAPHDNDNLLTGTCWVGFHFNSNKDVAQVAINADAAYGPSGFVIEYSDDGSVWNEALAVNNYYGFTGGWSTFDLPLIPAPISYNSTEFNADGDYIRPAYGRVAYVQVWGPGGDNCGGGGGYAEAFLRVSALDLSTPVTVGLASGDTSSFGTSVIAYSGQDGGVTGGNGSNAFGPNNPPTGEGLGNTGSAEPTGGLYAGGGGHTSGDGAASVYGGGGGGSTNGGASLFGGAGGNGTVSPAVPGGGGGPSQSGAAGRVLVTVF